MTSFQFNLDRGTLSLGEIPYLWLIDFVCLVISMFGDEEQGLNFIRSLKE